MDNTAIFEKVSELEWYLTMQAYLKNKMQSNSSFSLPYITIEDFHAIYQRLKPPMVWNETGMLGCFAPFNDTCTLMPNQSIEIPLGFSIDEEIALVQPAPEKILQAHYKVAGKCKGIGNVLCITNISNEPYNFNMMENKPLCLFDLATLKSDVIMRAPEYLQKEIETPGIIVPISTEENGKIVRKEIAIDADAVSELFKRLSSGYVI